MGVELTATSLTKLPGAPNSSEMPGPADQEDAHGFPGRVVGYVAYASAPEMSWLMVRGNRLWSVSGCASSGWSWESVPLTTLRIRGLTRYAHTVWGLAIPEHWAAFKYVDEACSLVYVAFPPEEIRALRVALGFGARLPPDSPIGANADR